MTARVLQTPASDAATAAPGRVCPLRYRYGAGAIAQAETRHVQSLYVIGGLYGNVPALDEVERMRDLERVASGVTPTLCFNGDFNWFDVADDRFAEINRRVLVHDALVGNVEAEFAAADDDAGCGCAYPDAVDSGVVERSNQIHAMLKATARRHPDIAAEIEKLPMFARYQVGDCTIGVVHGDADSLAGWRFDVEALDAPEATGWLRPVFSQAQVDVFASTHTCLPAMRAFPLAASSQAGWVVNNGAAGMPNFYGEIWGLCTRIGCAQSPHAALHEVRVGGAYVSLLPVRYDAIAWRDEFLRQWPAGTAAWTSYWTRITRGPDHQPTQAVPRRIDP
jgi:hypothetical protein